MMADDLIGPQQVSTPAELRRSGARELPEDFVIPAPVALVLRNGAKKVLDRIRRATQN